MSDDDVKKVPKLVELHVVEAPSGDEAAGLSLLLSMLEAVGASKPPPGVLEAACAHFIGAIIQFTPATLGELIDAASGSLNNPLIMSLLNQTMKKAGFEFGDACAQCGLVHDEPEPKKPSKPDGSDGGLN